MHAVQQTAHGDGLSVDKVHFLHVLALQRWPDGRLQELGRGARWAADAAHCDAGVLVLGCTMPAGPALAQLGGGHNSLLKC